MTDQLDNITLVSTFRRNVALKVRPSVSQAKSTRIKSTRAASLEDADSLKLNALEIANHTHQSSELQRTVAFGLYSTVIITTIEISSASFYTHSTLCRSLWFACQVCLKAHLLFP